MWTPPLWPMEIYFPGAVVKHIHQEEDYSCVPTCLAMLQRMKERAADPKMDEAMDEAAAAAEDKKVAAAIAKNVNTQDPRTWSKYLIQHGMKLAYLPTDVRPLEMYLEELSAYKDLFLLSYYTGTRDAILAATKEKAQSEALKAARLSLERFQNDRNDRRQVEAQNRINALEAGAEVFQAGDSHVVILCGETIFDPMHELGTKRPAEVKWNDYIKDKKEYYDHIGRNPDLHTKRLFRVVPADPKKDPLLNLMS